MSVVKITFTISSEAVFFLRSFYVWLHNLKIMKLIWGRKYFFFLFSFSIFLFIMLQVFLYRKKTTRFKSKILQSTNVLFYEDSYFTEEPDVSYHGFNSCVVSSKADYDTLDFLQKLEINHRNKLSSFYKPVKKTHLDILEVKKILF